MTDPTQVFLGFRVPTGTRAPAAFTSSSTGPSNSGPQLQLGQSSAYTGELQRLDPAPAGQEWVGYVSQYVSYNGTKGEQNFTARADFALPTHGDGTPFSGPFAYRTVVGGRQWVSSGTPDPREPIDCGKTLTGGSGFSPTETICADDPAQATIDTNDTVTTRDAGITPGAALSVSPGKKASVPFTFKYAGSATPAASFSLTASTGVPKTTASPSKSTITPASDSSTPVTVSVPIPAHTTPGTYTVTLTARLADGELRQGSAHITVLPVCLVPHLTGRRLAKARKLTHAAGCRLGKVSQRHGKKQKGRILSQHPAPGQIRPVGTKVSVTTSLGP